MPTLNPPVIAPPVVSDSVSLRLVGLGLCPQINLPSLLSKRGEGPGWIITLNPEMLVAAHRDLTYYSVLEQAHERIADGVGLKIMAKIFKRKNIPRLTGIDLVKYSLAQAQERGEVIGLLNYPGALSSNAQLVAMATALGVSLIIDTLPREESRCSLFCHAVSGPSYLFISWGHPFQEFWIARHRDHLGGVKMVAGIGGAFDFLTGVMPRAPRFLQVLGLEWLWRLSIEPKRWRRIIDAIIIFPYLAWRYG